MLIKTVKAKRKYKCDLTHVDINIGEEYKRVNIRDVGIYHFKNTCSDKKIKKFFYEKFNTISDEDVKYLAECAAFGLNGIEW